MALSLQPYSYDIPFPDYYFFTTDSGDKYECYFLSYKEYFLNYPIVAPYIFSFNLDLLNKPAKHKGIDSRIADTVITIVGNFLEARINAVVYVCDTTDGKQAARYRKFKSWFSYYDHASHNIHQMTTTFEVGGITLHTALLIHKKNRQKDEFVAAYFSLTDEK